MIGALVFASFLCMTPEVMLEATQTKDPMARSAMLQVDCRPIRPQWFEITSIAAGPVRDFEGDETYVVEVMPGIYSFAWAGHNTRPAVKA